MKVSLLFSFECRTIFIWGCTVIWLNSWNNLRKTLNNEIIIVVVVAVVCYRLFFILTDFFFFIFSWMNLLIYFCYYVLYWTATVSFFLSIFHGNFSSHLKLPNNAILMPLLLNDTNCILPKNIYRRWWRR